MEIKTLPQFQAIAFTIPFGGALLVLLILSVLNPRVNSFILKTVIGVEVTKEEEQQQNDEKSRSDGDEGEVAYLYIPTDHEDHKEPPVHRCWIRFLGDVVVAIIMGVFIAIISQNLILNYDTVKMGGNCPEFDAYCFPSGLDTERQEYKCKVGEKVNFTSDRQYFTCYGFVYEDRDISDVLDTLGTCGGLLGLISMIAPLFYYLARYKGYVWRTLLFVVIPVGVIVLTFCLTFAIYKEALSTLTYIFLSLVAFITTVSWSVAMYRTCKDIRKNGKTECRYTFPFCYCLARKGDGSFGVDRLSSCRDQLDKCWCCSRYSDYPFCCLSDYCPSCCSDSEVSRATSEDNNTARVHPTDNPSDASKSTLTK